MEEARTQVREVQQKFLVMRPFKMESSMILQGSIGIGRNGNTPVQTMPGY